MTSRAYCSGKKVMDGKIQEEGKRGQVKQEKVDLWPNAARRNLIQVSTRYTCTVLHRSIGILSRDGNLS